MKLISIADGVTIETVSAACSGNIGGVGRITHVFNELCEALFYEILYCILFSAKTF